MARDFEEGYLGGVAGYVLAGLYGALASLDRRRKLAGRRIRPGLPVLSIGNLTTGGTGKTPLTVWAARELVARGIPVAIVARDCGGPVPRAASDEAAVHAELVPEALVLAGRSKARLAARAASMLAAAAGAPADSTGGRARGCVLVDDAFSHPALVRDLDLVLVDARRPLGNAHLLPRGPLREPPQALARADAIVVTRADLIAPALLDGVLGALGRLAPQALLATGRHHLLGVAPAGGAQAPAPPPPGQAAVCLSGLARRGELARAARGLGLNVVADLCYPDHHRFREGEWRRALAEARLHGAWLLVSRKDAVRLGSDARRECHVLEVAFEPLREGERLVDLITRAAQGPLRPS